MESWAHPRSQDGSSHGGRSSHGDGSADSSARASEAADYDDFDTQNLDGLEMDDVGDLDDVPHDHIREVVELLHSLPGPDDNPGDIHALRFWIDSLNRVASYSKTATIELLKTIAQCLEAVRPKPVRAQDPTRNDLQKAFIRMRGIRYTIDVMLMQLNIPAVVAQAARTLAACAQVNPLAAEDMFADGPQRMRLMMRAIERHDHDYSVIESACMLFSHLCSLTAQKGAPHAQARVEAHKHIQSLLASEAGAIGMLVHILINNLQDVEAQQSHTDALHKKKMEPPLELLEKPKKGGSKQTNPIVESSETINKREEKGSMELKQAWLNLSVVESAGARIQECVLQALLLMIFTNADTTRQFAGELWIVGNSRFADEEALRNVAAVSASHKATHKIPHKGKHHKGGHHKKGRGAFLAPVVAPEEVIVEKHNLTTLDAFARQAVLLLDVIRGRAARDRPMLVSQVMRLLSVLADQTIGMLKHIEKERAKEHEDLRYILEPGPVPGENPHFHQPFETLKAIVNAVMYALRTHKTDAQCVTEALCILSKLKEVAMLSPPADMNHRSPHLLRAWQHLVGEAELNGEVDAGNAFLKRVVHDTDAANERMRVTGASPDELTGDNQFLTPRLRDVAFNTTVAAAEIVGDTIASAWRKGEPERHHRQFGDLLENMEEEVQEDQATKAELRRKAATDRKKASQGKHHKKGAKVKHLEDKENHQQARRGSKTPAHEAAVDEGGKQASHKHQAKKLATQDQVKPDAPVRPLRKNTKHKEPPSEWMRSMAFDTHDEEDFTRVWRGPLEEALKHALFMPAVEQQRKDRMAAVHRTSCFGVGAKGMEHLSEHMGDTAPKIHSTETPPMTLELLESEQGILRTKLTLPSMDEGQKAAQQTRLNHLIADPCCASVVSELYKGMRKQSQLLPVYGIQVQMKKGIRTREVGLTNTFNNGIAALGGETLQDSVRNLEPLAVQEM